MAFKEGTGHPSVYSLDLLAAAGSSIAELAEHWGSDFAWLGLRVGSILDLGGDVTWASSTRDPFQHAHCEIKPPVEAISKAKVKAFLSALANPKLTEQRWVVEVPEALLAERKALLNP